MCKAGSGYFRKSCCKRKRTLDRASMATITNPDDLAAVEAALKLKDETGAQVTVVSMGPPPAEGMLRECIAMGADDAVLISGRDLEVLIRLQLHRLSQVDYPILELDRKILFSVDVRQLTEIPPR